MDHRVYQVRRGQAPRPLLPTLKNVRFLTPGLGNGIIVKEGSNKAGDLGKLWFPRESTFIRLLPELFEGDDPEQIYSLHYSQKTGRLIAQTPQRLWPVPTESVLALARHNATTERELRT